MLSALLLSAAALTPCDYELCIYRMCLIKGCGGCLKTMCLTVKYTLNNEVRLTTGVYGLAYTMQWKYIQECTSWFRDTHASTRVSTRKYEGSCNNNAHLHKRVNHSYFQGSGEHE